MSILTKYNLPNRVRVWVDNTPEGSYVVTFPDLPGCMTEAKDVIDLIYQVNDAIFTYHDVARKDLKGIDFLYAPPQSFLGDIKNLKPKVKSYKKVDFHIPYALV